MTPDEKLFSALGRLHPLLRILFGVWLGISILFVAVDDLRQNLPLWLIIFLATPWVAISTYLALSMNWAGFRSIGATFRTPEPSTEPDPADQYRAGEISHPEMMRRYEQREWRNLEDTQGCTLIFAAVLLPLLVLAPRHADNSVKAEFVTPALIVIGLVSAYLLWGGRARRAVKWACYTFLTIAVVGVPIGIVSIARS
jgi:hypothetical protein